MELGKRYWTSRFSDWAAPLPADPGYTLLVPVPGDLPVFLEVALAVTGQQKAEHRLETLVIPDVMTPQVKNIVERNRANWQGKLTLLPLPQPERTMLPRMKNPSRNHAVQVITGIEHSRSTHVLLHDADLFLLDKGALDQRYQQAVERDLDALGISPVWDPWYNEKGLTHLAATWELMASRDWLRAFPPHMHMGHTAEMYGEDHVFDTTLRAQALGNPARIAQDNLSDEIVHFNYVISTYRHFQRSSGSFTDDRYRLILVRLLIDLFAQEPFDYVVPTLAELAKGLDDPTARVVYPSGEKAAADYASFRSQIQRTFHGEWCEAERGDRAEAELAPFDAHYGYTGDNR
ncbi:hypothetical protein [Luteococcus sanguinis]|uniref:Glycosyltransferase n=1 Tax=Luteococcus sanguinis TaxID=174038 RepID=A0ABW1X3V2_9ACTN